MEIYTLLSKYLSGEATCQEIAELEEWRTADEKNEKEFRELSESWKLAHESFSFVVPDKEKVWNRIVTNLNRMQPIRTYSRAVIYRAVSVAATVALLIGLSLPMLFSAKEPGSPVSFKAPMGQKAEVDLPDGTRVFLNSGSVLTYSTDYNRTNRSVTLRGQAFFNVAKDEEHPFDVSVGNVKVVVHGTSFDVNGYEDTSEIAVTLLTGRVSILSSLSDKVLATMKPNQKAIISLSAKDKCTLADCDAEAESVWRLGKLKINGEGLAEVTRKMERWYGVKIALDNVNPDKHYWMTIKTESLKETLEIINRITPINYSINGEEVAITCR